MTLAENDILKKVFRNYLHNKNLKAKFCNKPVELLKFFLIWDTVALNIVEHAIRDCEIIWGLIRGMQMQLEVNLSPRITFDITVGRSFPAFIFINEDGANKNIKNSSGSKTRSRKTRL